MSTRLIEQITAEGFTADILEYPDGRVEFTADADIDADGANGQIGEKAAYMAGDAGSELLANGGMGMKNGAVVGVKSWYKDIVICGANGQPRMFPGGLVASKTSYVRHVIGSNRAMAADDPSAYIDAETIAYIAIPPIIIAATKGAVMGCRTRVTNLANGKVSEGIVADVGPRTKVGEVSIQMARELGLDPSPRSGGVSTQTIRYEIWPGVVSPLLTIRVRLRTSAGVYL